MTAPVSALSPGLLSRNRQPISFPATNPEDPGVPSLAYTRMLARAEKCRALMEGSDAIREMGVDALPQLEGESDEAYDVRKVLAALFPAFARTVAASVGMLLQQEPQLGNDMPQELVDLSENIDGIGTNWVVFCANLARHALVDGMDGVIVDHQRPDDPGLDRSRASAAAAPGTRLSADDEKRLGLRPYWLLFKLDDIIKPIYEVVNGVRTLTVLSLRRVIQRRVGSFGIEQIVTYRVYRNEGGKGVITFQLYEEPVGGGVRKAVGEAHTLQNIKRIPWSPLVAGQELSDDEVLPTLQHLADLNLEHHQIKTNILNLETLGCVPTPVRVGSMPDADGNYPTVTLGPRNTIEAPATQGVSQPFYWTSPDVSVLSPAQTTLQGTEQAMAREGGAFLAPDPSGVESVEAKRIKGAAQRATLSTVARALQDCLERAWQDTASYLKLNAGSVVVNREFEQPIMSSDVMLAYVTAVKEAGLPPEILVEAWQKGGRINDDRDPEEIVDQMLANQAAILEQQRQQQEDQMAALQARGAAPAGPGNGPPPGNDEGNTGK